MGLLMKEEDVARVKRIADRERAPMYVVGETTNDMKFVFEQADGVKPIDIKLEYMFGKPPRTVMTDHTVTESYQTGCLQRIRTSPLFGERTSIGGRSLQGLVNKQSRPFRNR